MGTHLPNQHSCDICDATYSRRYRLSAHKLKMHNIVTTTEYVKYVCDHCSYNTHHKGTFDRHYNSKHGAAIPAIHVHSAVTDSLPHTGLGPEPPASTDTLPEVSEKNPGSPVAPITVDPSSTPTISTLTITDPVSSAASPGLGPEPPASLESLKKLMDEIHNLRGESMTTILMFIVEKYPEEFSYILHVLLTKL